MNIALVVLDTLRKDRFDDYFDWIPGTRFENAWSTGHSTVLAHGSLFTGLYPSESGIHMKSPTFDDGPPLLAERLSEDGYRTRMFSANVFISPAFGATEGIDEYHSSWRQKGLEDGIVDWGEFVTKTRGEGPTRFLRAIGLALSREYRTIPSLKLGVMKKLRNDGLLELDDGARGALDFVRSADFGEDEFLFVNLMEAHTPYNPPGCDIDVENRFRASLTGFDGDPENVQAAYDEAAAYLSDVYEDIYEELRDSFDLVITVADHGELLGEHGFWDHQYGVFPELTRIPMVVDDGRTEGSIEEVVSLLDVHATVLAAAGRDEAAEASRGIDVRNREELAERERPHLTSYHGIGEQTYENLESEGFDADRLDVDLHGLVFGDDYWYQTFEGSTWFHRSEAETGDEVEAVDRPEEHLETVLEGLDREESPTTEASDIDDAVETRLEELGYR